MSLSPLAEWSELADRFYRRHELPLASAFATVLPPAPHTLIRGEEMSGLVSRCVVSCAQFAGPMAVVAREGKGGGGAPADIALCSGGGALISRVSWSARAPLMGMAWTEDLLLLCLRADGQVESFDLAGKAVSCFGMGRATELEGIAMHCVWGSGVAVLTHVNTLSVAEEVSLKTGDPVSHRVLEFSCPLSEDEVVLAMCVVEGHLSASGETEVLLSTKAHIYTVTSEKHEEHEQSDDGPILMFAVSPNGQFLAGFTEGGSMLVFSSDFSQYISKFDTGSPVCPQQLAWCGTDSVLMYWEDLGILMVGPQGDWIKYTYEEPAVLIPEADGVRVLTDSCIEFLSRVPDELVSIHSIGSTDPGALLYQALEHYDSESSAADEYLRMIGNDRLSEAITTCLQGAMHEWDSSRQKLLLRAAAYGQAFNPTGKASFAIRDAVYMLRILNEIRSPTVGMPISYCELQNLSVRLLLNRLSLYSHHLLALRISELLKFDSERILMHWANAKISASASDDDEVVCKILVRALSRSHSVSYAAVASDAYRFGRRRLAAMLLEFEHTASQQIPLLVQMGESEVALAKAVDCGDPNLIFLVLFRVMSDFSFPDFASLLNRYPKARDMFIAYCKDTDPDLQVEVVKATAQQVGMAECLIREAYVKGSGRDTNPFSSNSDNPGLEMRMCLERALDAYGTSREDVFPRKAIEEAVKFCSHPALKKLTGSVGSSLSVSDVIRSAIQNGDLATAQRLKADFRVPEKRWCWLRVRVYAETKNWEALERFSREKTPAIGFMPFVEMCIAHDAPQTETAKYISRIQDLTERASAFETAGLMKEAMAAASQAKNSTLLDRMRVAASTVSSQSMTSTLESFRSRLSTTLNN